LRTQVVELFQVMVTSFNFLKLEYYSSVLVIEYSAQPYYERYVPQDQSETLSFGRHFQQGLDSERLSLIS